MATQGGSHEPGVRDQRHDYIPTLQIISDMKTVRCKQWAVVSNEQRMVAELCTDIKAYHLVSLLSLGDIISNKHIFKKM